MDRRRPAVVLMFVVLLALHSPANAQKLRVVASDWPPYVEVSIPRSGVAVALVTTALQRAGYTVQLFLDNWPRSLTATQTGNYDAILGIWYTEKRAATLAFSEPFLANELRFMKRTGDAIEVRERADLVGLRVGIVEDYAYGAEPYDTTGIDVVSGGSVGDNVQGLLDGELDLVLGDGLVLRHAADQRRAAKEVELLPLVIATRGLYLGVSRQRPDYAAVVSAFNESIEAMRADGTLNSMLANYRVNN
jgi:polar amino acid transport system substrate-binding protein